MRYALLTFAATATLALVAGGPSPMSRGTAAQPPEKAQPDPRAKNAEPLPDAPKLDPKNNLIEGTPDKTLFVEQGADKQLLRVLLVTEVCLREGSLEVFLCRKGTKEHEAILRSGVDAEVIHAALLAVGAKPGQPAQFVNAKNEIEFKPATGTKVKVTVVYRKDGKVHSHPAQEWVWNATKKRPLEYDWVFAGSQLIKDPDRPNAKPFYGANSGEVISISNFPYSMLDVTGEIGKDDANLNYEAKTDRIPPLFSKVWVILEPVPEKK
jgi:hypothetical protein